MIFEATIAKSTLPTTGPHLWQNVRSCLLKTGSGQPFIHQGTGGKKKYATRSVDEIQVGRGFHYRMIEASNEIDEGKKLESAAPPNEWKSTVDRCESMISFTDLRMFLALDDLNCREDKVVDFEDETNPEV